MHVFIRKRNFFNLVSIQLEMILKRLEDLINKKKNKLNNIN
jgi:hypothetical protein